jgi:predicted SprT family Zn-dependent metalloprotease
MDLLEARNIATNLLLKHGLKSWVFDFDESKRRFGACHFKTKRITLSRHLVSLNDKEIVINTILHEIAHALVGREHGHNSIWVAKAREIGCTGDRCYDSSVVATPPHKYIGSCPNNHIFKAHRISKHRQSCTTCFPKKFNADYVITFRINPEFGK